MTTNAAWTRRLNLVAKDYFGQQKLVIQHKDTLCFMLRMAVATSSNAVGGLVARGRWGSHEEQFSPFGNGG